ncbi:MAG: adenosylmethionine decarboxylase [Candidatus Cloacimonadota bacterium]|nr:MAG: adenosylmethionine decarboxylase [Candidatus Cloacimonadota bacterium]
MVDKDNISGIHILANMYGIDSEKLKYLNTIEKALKETVEKAKLSMVGSCFHQFEPIGVTGVVLLAESHISIHTWPENNTAVIDVYTCGHMSHAKKAYDVLYDYFQPSDVDLKEITR